jgi:glycosyltransferase involved in cell wall biosynthesis
MRLLVLNMAMDLDDPAREFIVYWVKALAKRVEFVHVITMRAGRLDLPDNVRVYSVGKEKGYSEPRRVLEFYRHLLNIVRKDRIDVCFSHMIAIFTILAAPILKIRGVPIITWYAHRQVTTTLKVAHLLSDIMVTNAETAYCYKHDKLVVIGHGIDTDLFSPDGITLQGRPILLSVGRISPIKDVLTLIEACYLLRQKGYSIQCALIGGANKGDRVYEKTVHRSVEKLVLNDAVQFVGTVPHREVVHWYRRCFAHVNLCPTGALDKAALEAMACGRPSVAANEGFRETMGPYADLLLFRHRDAQDLSQKLEYLLNMSEARLKAMGEALSRSVVARHSLERLAGLLLKIFEDVARE